MEKGTNIPKQILLRVSFISLSLLFIAAVAILYQNSAANLLERLANAVGTTGEPAAAKNHSSTAAPSLQPTIVPLPPPPNTGESSTKNDSSVTQPSAAPPPAATTAPAKTDEHLLNGLLSTGFDEESCLSRYQSHFYRKPSPHKPSKHLVAKLRSYESLHRRCGPGTEPYNQTIKKLLRSKSQTGHSIPFNNNNTTTDCKYVVWLPVNGLGNRMLSLVSTFLYSMLTDRVLLVEFSNDMSGLFCEPFLNSTWESSTSFSSRRTPNLGLPSYEEAVEKMIISNLMTNTTNASFRLPPIMFVDLEHRRERNANYFHCDESQHLLEKVQILVLRSDQYFVPSLFVMTPSFKKEMNRMFPDKETVFHHLGRYLFHPADTAWGLITRFYQSYLHEADERIGIQIRVFAKSITPTETIMRQILSCTLRNRILPDTEENKDFTMTSVNQTRSKAAVLVTSLYPEYSDQLREMYLSKPTKTGEIVAVYQPTSEGVQKYNDGEQSVKALTEMYLLSMCDVLVTSGRSTFGYVAQGLAGVRPWVMYKTAGVKVRDPACVRDFSIDPCFHYPPKYECSARKEMVHISEVFDGVRKCEDARAGVKMVGSLDLER